MSADKPAQGYESSGYTARMSYFEALKQFMTEEEHQTFQNQHSQTIDDYLLYEQHLSQCIQQLLSEQRRRV